MPHLKNIAAVAHAWANESQESGRSSNLFFEDGKIYSYGYHFMIAQHVKNPSGQGDAVLFTERRYSNSTEKQISKVRFASHHLNVIYVPDPANEYDANVIAWTREGEGIVQKLLSARKPEIYLHELSQLGDRVYKYHHFFGLVIPALITAILNISNKEEYAKYSVTKESLLQAKEKEANRALAIQHKNKLDKWLNGEGHTLSLRDGFDYLRVRNERVETSQGIELRIKDATDLYRKIVSGKLSVGDKVLGSYTVSEVGDLIKIGCHTFKTSYLIKFGEGHLYLNNQ